MIDDETASAPHALFSWRRLGVYAGVGFAIWACALGALSLAYGWESTLTQIGWFFTEAALLTFGGAYAALPYVYHGAVEQYQWLTGAQMIDGLALGETTPAPLIMVVAFVVFLAAWGKEIFGPENLLLAGIAGASVATFFTFLPSFLFILIGGPIVESSRGNIGFTAPLTAISAAVVGVILSLAAFFAYHVLWPQGFAAPFDWISAVLGIAALLALWGSKVDVLHVIAASALVGVILTLSGFALP